MLNRRELLSVLLGSQVAALSGCARKTLPPAGELLAPNFAVGHQIRDAHQWPAAKSKQKVDTLIVGGGMAGLSAAWRLQKAGVEDFVVLEMDDSVGGTARSGTNGSFAYPWGAHYVPTPMADNVAMIGLLSEMGVVESIAEDGSPKIAEQYLCRDPEERVFFEGEWYHGLYPFAGATDDDKAQLAKFQAQVNDWVTKRDDQGRRMFAIPNASGSTSESVMALDQESMADWVDRNGFTSERLRWVVDYSCRDDYGLSIDQTSAWAGMFYFAARIAKPGDESQAVITWPEGNGRIVNHLAAVCGDRVRSNHAVTSIENVDGGVDVNAWNVAQRRAVAFTARRVIFAAPQFLVPHLIRGLNPERIADAKQFQYGSWVVANLHLSDRPNESKFPMCWDNVIYGSKSLGYVTSTHPTGLDHGPTVVTWYYPITGSDPRLKRKELLALGWSDWADVVMTDLRVPHPDIGDLVTRLDVMQWGHAMVQPRVGFVSGAARTRAALPFDAIHFAGTDLSGVALFEEAFYHGVRAAEEVMQAIGVETSSVL